MQPPGPPSAGVREPRRPLPVAPGATAVAEPERGCICASPVNLSGDVMLTRATDLLRIRLALIFHGSASSSARILACP